ncbi:MAG: AMP-binding protein [Desulfobacterales bacterium]|nr:AMP-binding protein [Desulfobacterales bacterium]
MSKPTRYTQELMDEYLRKGYWEHTTWPEVWDRNAGNYPDREAIVDSQTRLTWSQAKKLIDRLALGLLQLGFKRDDLLALQLPNSVEVALLRLACEKAGILCLPALAALRQRELEYILRNVEATGIVIPLEFRNFNHFQMVAEIRARLPRLRHVFVTGDNVPEGAVSIQAMLSRPLEEEYPPDYLRGRGYKSNEISWISHTSGSTGFPKFVEIAAAARMNMCRAFAEDWRMTGDDIIAALSPHTGGPNVIVYWSAALVGAKVVMMENFGAEEALKLIEREKVTGFGFVPTQLIMMMNHPDFSRYDLSSMRLWVCAAGAPPYELCRKLEEKIGGRVVQIYGAVDWGAGVFTRFDSSQEERLLTTGKPIHGHEIRLVDNAGSEVGPGEVGEVMLRGPAACAGYYRNPEMTWEVWTKDGWYKTGDLARLDGKGHVILVGRKKDMIKRGGENIYPVEIETMLETHPRVRSVAIVKMPDLMMGEKACAYVVPEKGQEFTFEEMVSFLQKNGIAAFKLPERLELVEALPLTAGIQKVDKAGLERQIADKLRAEV